MKNRISAVAIMLVLLTLAIAANVPWSKAQQVTAQAVEPNQAANQATPAMADADQTQAPESDFKSSPVMIVENAGQWDAGARFQVWGGPAGTMWLAEDAIWITVVEDGEPEDQRSEGHEVPERSAVERTGRSMDRSAELRPGYSDAPRRGVAIKLSFVGANPHPQIEAYDRLDTKVSYFLGNDPEKWRPEVPVWGGVRYVDLYPGVDLVIGQERGSLPSLMNSLGHSSLRWRLDAEVGANTEAIRLRVEGADRIEVDDHWLHVGIDGDGMGLVLPAAAFDLQVESARSSGQIDVVSVRPGDARAPGPALPAFVGPSDNPSELLYGSYLGGGDDDDAGDITVDGAGRIYLAGETLSSDFPSTPGVVDPIQNGSQDAFVATVNASTGVLEYATFLGGAGSDFGSGIVLGASGEVYLSGRTDSANFPATNGAFDTGYGGGGDAFVAWLDGNGTESGLVHVPRRQRLGRRRYNCD